MQGPPSNMIMLERYLSAGATPALTLVEFYTGNDGQNLADSSWDELSRCELPTGRIRRRDVVPRGVARPAWLLTSGLGASHLFTALTAVDPGQEPLSPVETVQLLRLLGDRAVGDMKDGWPTAGELTEAARMAALYSKQLGQSACLSSDERGMLAPLSEMGTVGDWRAAYPIALALGRRLFEEGCLPLDTTEMAGVAPLFNSYAGYYWSKIEKKPTGNIQLYSRLLRSLAKDPAWSSFTDAFSRIRAKLDARDPSVESDTKALNVQLQNQFGDGVVKPGAGCDPLALVFRQMAARAGHLLVVVLPAEYQLKYVAKDAGVESLRPADGEARNRLLQHDAPVHRPLSSRRQVLLRRRVTPQPGWHRARRGMDCGLVAAEPAGLAEDIEVVPCVC